MKNYGLVTLIVMFLSLSMSLTVKGQEDSLKVENPISISCDLMSRYVWRGTDFGGSPSIQPGIEYSKKGFTLGAWGAYATNQPGVQEMDLFVSYTIKEIFTVTITDYYFPDELTDYKYYDFDDQTTGHVLEASLSFDGTEKLPLSLMVATNVWGADARKIKDDGTTGDLQYSTYAEASYAFKNFDLFMGFNLTSVDRDKGESGFYGDYMGVVNLGLTTTKEIEITDKFKLPLQVSLITNPQAEKIYLVAGFTF